MKKNSKNGFTLIELSIVLVIIGLIVGGILMGQDLITAAAARAQISQIEKYQAAANTFRSKYGYLPGDIPDPIASQYGFVTRGTVQGQGDGNGLLEGFTNYASGDPSGYGASGETTTFWHDLSAANLVDGGFNAAYPTVASCSWCGGGITVASYLPQAKIGGGNYVYVFSAGTYTGMSPNTWIPSGGNYFGVGAVPDVGWFYSVSQGLTVQQAYNIDKKIDDGLAQTGRVITVVPGGPSGGLYGYWVTPAGTTQATASGSGYAPITAPTAGSTATCFDNNSTLNAVQQYSMGYNNGSSINCALALRFQ